MKLIGYFRSSAAFRVRIGLNLKGITVEHASRHLRKGEQAAPDYAALNPQKLVPTLAAAHERIYQHSLPLEDARAQAAYGQHSQVGKILEIHTELPGRIHVVLIRQQVGY